MPYLTLGEDKVNSSQAEMLDRAIKYPFRPDKDSIGLREQYLLKASSSVMLTLALPEDSEHHKEETSLLMNPQALWTVLVINGPLRFILDHDRPEHLTPVAQFLRGITASLHVQRSNAQTIFEALKDHLRKHDDDSLFDDEHFTRTRLYHWVIKTCHELCGLMASNLRFIRRLLNDQISTLRGEAHAHEALGIAYWMRRLEEHVSEMDELQAEVHALREQVRESVRVPSSNHSARSPNSLANSLIA